MEFKNTKEYLEIKSICKETIRDFSKYFSLHFKDIMVSSFFFNQQSTFVYIKPKQYQKESLIPPRNRSNIFAPPLKPKFSCLIKGWKEVNLDSRYGVYEIEVSTSLHHPPYTIFKRYREFHSLYKELSKLINRSGVKFTFPSTSSNQKFFHFKKNERKFDPEFHAERGSILQIFLKLLCGYEPTSNHPKFHQFLYFDYNYSSEVQKTFDISVQSLLDQYKIVNTQFFTNSMEETMSSILILRLHDHYERIKKKTLPLKQLAIKSFHSIVSKYSKKVYDIVEESTKLKIELTALKSLHSDVLMKTKYRVEEDIIKRKNFRIPAESLSSIQILIEELAKSTIPKILEVIYDIGPKINNFIDTIEALIDSDKSGNDLLNEISILITTCSNIKRELIDKILSIKNAFNFDNKFEDDYNVIFKKIKILPDILIKAIECYMNPRYLLETYEKFISWTHKLKNAVNKDFTEKMKLIESMNKMSVQENDIKPEQNFDTSIQQENGISSEQNVDTSTQDDTSIQDSDTRIQDQKQNDIDQEGDTSSHINEESYENQRVSQEFLQSFLDKFENDMISTIHDYYESMKLSSKNVLSYIKMNFEYQQLIDIFLDLGMAVSNLWLNYFKKLVFKFSDYITILSFIVHPTNFNQAVKDCIIVGFTKANSYGYKTIMNIIDDFVFDIETFLLSDILNDVKMDTRRDESIIQETLLYIPERFKTILDFDNILSSCVSQYIRRKIEPLLTKKIFSHFKDEVIEKVIYQVTEPYEKRIVLEYQLSNALYNEIVSNNIHIKSQSSHKRQSSSSSITNEQKLNDDSSTSSKLETTISENSKDDRLSGSESSDIKSSHVKQISDGDNINSSSQEVVRDELKERKKLLPRRPTLAGRRTKRSNTIQFNQEYNEDILKKERSYTACEPPPLFKENIRIDPSNVKIGKADGVEKDNDVKIGKSEVNESNVNYGKYDGDDEKNEKNIIIEKSDEGVVDNNKGMIENNVKIEKVVDEGADEKVNEGKNENEGPPIPIRPKPGIVKHNLVGKIKLKPKTPPLPKRGDNIMSQR